MMRRFRVGISPGVCILWALMLLVLPLNWLFACWLAAGFHEFCHYAAVKCCGGRVTDLSFGILGAGMRADGMSLGKTLLCTLAGPIGGGVLVLTWARFPRLAICTGIHSLFNLLPVMPLDGGVALFCGLCFAYPQTTAVVITRRIGQAICILALIIGLIGFLRLDWGFSGMIPGILLISATPKEKYLAKKAAGVYNRDNHSIKR